MGEVSAFHQWGRCAAGHTTMAAASEQRIRRPHGLPIWTLNCTIAGEGHFETAFGEFTTRKYDFVLIQPGAANNYGTGTHKQWQHLWATFQPDDAWMDLLQWPQLHTGYARVHVAALDRQREIRSHFQKLLQICAQTHVRRDRLALATLQLILCLLPSTHGATEQHDQLQPALDYANAHLAETISIDDLARVSGLSTSRFAHKFREQLGLAPYSWLERQRVAKASEALLMSQTPVATIARQVGYTDPAHFARVFKRHTYQTPSHFRKAAR